MRSRSRKIVLSIQCLCRSLTVYTPCRFWGSVLGGYSQQIATERLSRFCTWFFLLEFFSSDDFVVFWAGKVDPNFALSDDCIVTDEYVTDLDVCSGGETCVNGGSWCLNVEQDCLKDNFVNSNYYVTDMDRLSYLSIKN